MRVKEWEGEVRWYIEGYKLYLDNQAIQKNTSKTVSKLQRPVPSSMTSIPVINATESMMTKKHMNECHFCNKILHIEIEILQMKNINCRDQKLRLTDLWGILPKSQNSLTKNRILGNIDIIKSVFCSICKRNHCHLNVWCLDLTAIHFRYFMHQGCFLLNIDLTDYGYELSFCVGTQS